MSRPQQPFQTTVSKVFFVACIVIVLYLGFLLLQPFLIPLFLSIIVAVVSGSIYRYFLKLFRMKKALASLVTCLLLTIVMLIPILLIAGIMTNQALALYTSISNQIANNEMEGTLRGLLDYVAPLWQALQSTFDISKETITSQLGELVGKASNFLYTNAMNLVKGFTALIINFVLIIFITFYLLMDGRQMSFKVMSLSPLPQHLNRSIAQDMVVSIRTTIKGTFMLALLQGILNGVGFWIFNVPNSLFWGTLVIFASMVPLVGAALIWLPVSVYLLITGNVPGAVVVLVWGLIVGLVCDNILRPKILGAERGIHPLLTFFSVLGGLYFFGMVGLFIGPLILAVLISLLEVYQRYFLKLGEVPPKPEDD